MVVSLQLEGEEFAGSEKLGFGSQSSAELAFHLWPKIPSDLGRTSPAAPTCTKIASDSRAGDSWLMATDSNRSGPQPTAI